MSTLVQYSSKSLKSIIVRNTVSERVQVVRSQNVIINEIIDHKLKDYVYI